MKKIINLLKRRKNKANAIEYYRKLGVTIGENTTIIDSNIDEGHAYLIDIGDNCTLTHCTILAHDASTKRVLNKSKVGIVKIGNNCFIGWDAIILPNVKIGNNCIVGAGTVVSKNINDNSIVCGNPCKCIGKASDYYEKHKENMKTHPVFNTYWKNKSEEEKIKEKKLLLDQLGYDE